MNDKELFEYLEKKEARDRSMKDEYYFTMFILFAFALLMAFVPVSGEAPFWCRMVTVCVACGTGFNLISRQKEEQTISPLKIVCWCMLICSFWPFFFVMDPETVGQENTSNGIFSAEGILQGQEYAILLWGEGLSAFLVWIAFTAQKQGRKAVMIMSVATGAMIFFILLHITSLPDFLLCIPFLLLSIGFFRLAKLEGHQHI